MNHADNSVMLPQGLASRDRAEHRLGSNRTRDLSAADWRYLLPRLRFRRILHIGAPRATELAVLSGMATHTVILAGDPAVCAALQRELEARGIHNIELAAGLPGSSEQPEPVEPFDLIVAGAGPDGGRLVRGSRLRLLEALLARDGLVYIETEELTDALRLRFRRTTFEQLGFTSPAMLWLARRKGALRLALPLEAGPARQYLLDEIVAGVSSRGRALRQAARALTRLGLLHYAVPRRALLLGRANGQAEPEPVAPYVLEAMREAGVPLKEPRLAFYARGDHNSNKVIFVLFEGATPAAIVKLPRAPMYNARLEHEHRTLTRLAQADAAPAGTYPEPLFLRYHDELAMVGQSSLIGAAFRNATAADVGDPALHAGIEWITSLGERSVAERTDAMPRAGAQIHVMLDRFFATFPATPQERAFLEAQAERLTESTRDVPTVFQHGDAGTWNIVVEARSRVKFLDWEDGDARGMPLWDLFVFLESYSVWAGRLRGARDDVAAICGALFHATPYHRLLRSATAAYCERISLERALVEPLFYACWVDRALRTAPWVRGPGEHTMFFRLLRQAIQRRRGSALSCLFE